MATKKKVQPVIRAPQPRQVLPPITTPADYIARQEAAYYAKNPKKGTPPPGSLGPVLTPVKPRPTGTPTLAHPSTTAPPPTPIGPTPLSPMDLQKKLNTLGAGLKVDGIVGPLTRAAMAKYGMDQFGNVSAPQPQKQGLPALESQTSLMARMGGGAPDFSGALAALQGGLAGGGGGPTSIMAQLQSLLGAAPEIPQMDVRGEAQRRIDLKYGAAEAALARQMQQLGETYERGKKGQELYGQKGDVALANIFNALQTQLQQGQQRTAQNYETSAQTTGAAYDQAAAALQALNQRVTGGINEEAKRLGMEGGAAAGGAQSALANIMGSYQDVAGQNIANKAINANAIAGQKANELDFAQRQMTGVGRQGAQSRADFARDIQRALSGMTQQYQQDLGGLQAEQAEMARAKPLELESIMGELSQNQYGQQRQAWEDRLNQITKLGGLDIQNQQVQNEAAKGANQARQAIADLMARQESARSDYGLKLMQQMGDPLDREYKMAQIGKMGVDTERALEEINKLRNPAYEAGKTYMPALNQFLSTPQEGLWGQQAGPLFRSLTMGLTGAANQQTKLGMTGDPYQWAMANMLTEDSTKKLLAQHPGLNLEALKRALGIYYTGR